ncbi:MAG TPA: hypothetical protein VLR26_02190 [Frankiaceae bacterium]|nr:hypothetical protein [Frankiaceae bacterium]
MPQIVTKTGNTRTTLYRHLPPRPPESLTAGADVQTGEQGDGAVDVIAGSARGDH